MGDAYPELPLRQGHVMQVLRAEEERFADTLEHGMKVLEAALAEAQEDRGEGPAWRDGLYALRHLRLSFRPDCGRLPRTRHVRRPRRLRGGDGQAARARARRVDVQDGGRARIQRPQDRIRRLRHARGRCARRRTVSRRQRRRLAVGGPTRHRRPRSHALLRRIGRTGRRSRRTVDERCMPDVVRGARYAENSTRCLWPSRRGQDRRTQDQRYRGGARRRRFASACGVEPFRDASHARRVAPRARAAT